MERFDRETLLDLSVNVIPLVIILFFVVVFAVISPFGFSPVDSTIQFALLLAPFVALAMLTYYAGKAISNDEEKLEGRPGEYANVAESGLADGADAEEGDETDAEPTAEAGDTTADEEPGEPAE